MIDPVEKVYLMLQHRNIRALKQKSEKVKNQKFSIPNTKFLNQQVQPVLQKKTIQNQRIQQEQN